MSTHLKRLIERVDPSRTVLLFGAGSSIPSGAPTGDALGKLLAAEFGLPSDKYSLAEVAGIVEYNRGRRELVTFLRSLIAPLRPARGLLNLPLYNWASLFTTNYDTLVEQAYAKASRSLRVFSSNFDFTVHPDAEATKYFKLHGSIERDVCDGHVSRLIITESDYDLTEQYRESLYDRLKGELTGGHLLIIGQSLADPHIKAIATRASTIASGAGMTAKVSLLLYERDEERALLFERRGFVVAFGGIDEFFAELATRDVAEAPATDQTDPLSAASSLRPVTLDPSHNTTPGTDVSGMYNGWPATYANIRAGQTFERSVVNSIANALAEPGILVAVLLGASGLGKSTAARQAIEQIRSTGLHVWEHLPDYPLNANAWLAVAKRLASNGERGVLLVDEGHTHLYELNDLVDLLAGSELETLQMLVVSTRGQWNVRIKSPNFFKRGRTFNLGKLLPDEIERLLTLVETEPSLRALTEGTFSGFSRHERRRRLTERCASETFVCLKNIFASEKFDDIILREYATLSEPCQDIYRHVAALESAGVRVHRQLVVRLLGIEADQISSVLGQLSDVVHEYAINPKEGLFGWRGRHQVISEIVANFKFADPAAKIDLFSRVIDSTSPTYDIEIKSLRELCNVERGIRSVPGTAVQNVLFRRMMSAIPGERVPRHRLIRNLIQMGEYEKAEAEIRIFEKDFKSDGPIQRYKIDLFVARAATSPGLLDEDRVAILSQGFTLAAHSVKQFPYNKPVHYSFARLGIDYFRRTGDYSVFDSAISALRLAEERIGDPDIGRAIGRFEAQLGSPTVDSEFDDE